MAFPQVKVVARCTLHFIVSGSAFYSCLMRSDLNPQDLAVGWEGELSCGWEGSLSPTKVLGGGKLRFIAAFVRPQAVLPGVGVSRDDSHTAHKLSSCSPFDRQCSLDRWLHIPPQTYIKWIFFEVMVEPLLFHFRAGGQDLPFPTWLSLLKVPAGPAPAELGGGTRTHGQGPWEEAPHQMAATPQLQGVASGHPSPPPDCSSLQRQGKKKIKKIPIKSFCCTGLDQKSCDS